VKHPKPGDAEHPKQQEDGRRHKHSFREKPFT
jgi:hypothetical protein